VREAWLRQDLVERAEGQTPLQRRLAGLADQISVWGTFAAVFVFIALVASKVIAVLRDAQIASLERDLVAHAGRRRSGH
jgi:hypothetical protein